MDAYIVAGCRSAVGKAKRGGFRFTRPDTLAAEVLKHLVASMPDVDKEQIEDVIVGCATPEAEQGLNVGRFISLIGLDTDKVPGMTVNRYCSSGLETIAIASAKIHSGIADCIIAGGVLRGGFEEGLGEGHRYCLGRRILGGPTHRDGTAMNGAQSC